MDDIERLCYKPQEVAQMLNVSRNKVYELISSGELPSIKIGSSYKIPVDAFQAFLKKNTHPAFRGDEVPHVNAPEPLPDDPKMTAETIDHLNASNAKRKATGKPPLQGPYCLMCCGCFHLLRNDGSLAFFNPTRGDSEARVFRSLENLNVIARGLGWMATDEGNHRCPKCYLALRAPGKTMDGEREGCAIPAALLRPRSTR